MRIWKWPLELTDRQSIAIPEGAKLLTVQMQGNGASLWALVDEDAPIEHRTIAIYGTGNPMPESLGVDYVATFQTVARGLVFHVFDLGRR